MTAEHWEQLGKRLDALVLELAKLTDRIDRTLQILTNEDTALHQRQVRLETKLGRLREDVLDERAERLASSIPPPPATTPARFPPPLPKEGKE